jgi:hypothetical protein
MAQRVKGILSLSGGDRRIERAAQKLLRFPANRIRASCLGLGSPRRLRERSAPRQHPVQLAERVRLHGSRRRRSVARNHPAYWEAGMQRLRSRGDERDREGDDQGCKR